ncbi:MAG: HNH endonuclease family protein [Nitrosotalea sp.]
MKILRLVENYVFRRMICGIPTNSLNKTFAILSKTVNKDKYLESVQAAFITKTGYRRFPKDEEFQSQFMIKDVYNIRNTKYLLGKLENYNTKELVNIANCTVEHIMPQDKNLSSTWKQELGENWEEIQNKFLQCIGNLTLTGYNSELGNKSFLEKRNMAGGFADSPIRLNNSLAKLEHWNEATIQKRATELSDLALRIWDYPHISKEILNQYSVLDEEEESEEDEEDSVPFKKLGLDKKESKECPKCKLIKTMDHFGTRMINEVEYEQSQCIECR